MNLASNHDYTWAIIKILGINRALLHVLLNEHRDATFFYFKIKVPTIYIYITINKAKFGKTLNADSISVDYVTLIENTL